MKQEATTCGFHPGLRAHDLGCFPADELARRVAATVAGCVQLALGRAIDGFDLKPGVLDLSRLARIKPGIAILLEEVGPDQIPPGVQFIRNHTHEFIS